VRCPCCGVSVIWSKKPWRVMIGGQVVAIALLPVGILMGWDRSFSWEALFWAGLILSALLLALRGYFRLRFELTGTANQALQATAAPPCS